MISEICWAISLCLLLTGCLGALVIAKTPYRRGRLLTPTYSLLSAVFLSAMVLFYPIYRLEFGTDPVSTVKSILMSVHTVTRLFLMDVDFEFLSDFTDTAGNVSDVLVAAYSFLGAVLFVLGPFLTFEFILSFFKNITAYRRLLLNFRSDLYVFSELNEQSIALASSIKTEHARSLIVFTDVHEQEEENTSSLLETARTLNAICFRKDISDINWNLRHASRDVYLFTIGADEAENIEQSVLLIEQYGQQKNFRLFIFSSNAESEILFSTVPSGMRIRRINPVRSLTDHILFNEGEAIFHSALDDGKPEKLISAVLIGLGQHGTEMLKALPWFCQMDGYRVRIHAFDRDPQALEAFTVQCPELMDPALNGTFVDGEAQYELNIHAGVDVHSPAFEAQIRAIGQISYVFVALGNDSLNTQTAVTMRMLSERMGIHPYIHTIVYATSKKQALETVTDYRGHSYDIHFVGDLQSSYSKETIVDSQLHQIALQRHLRWGDESSFWAYEFNFHSSVAAAIHLKMRSVCKMPWAGKTEAELTIQERDALERLEHRRWNAYMRSEGYRHSGSVDKSSRNDLAKLHNNLVPYDQLPDKIKRVDSAVGSD